MKVLIVAGSFVADGMGRFAHDLVAALAVRSDISVTVLLPWKRSNFALPPNVTAITIPDMYRLPSLWQCIAYWRAVRRHARASDIVHFATDYPNFLLAAWRLERPYIITSHGTYTVIGLSRGMRRIVLRSVYRKARTLHAVSKYTAGRLHEILPDLTQVAIINHGVSSISEQAEAVGGHERSDRYILSAGSIKPRKGLHIALEAFALVAKDFPDVTYAIAGGFVEGGYMEQLRGIVREHDLENRVHFLGHISDEELERHFRDCEAYIQPSITEKTVFEGYGIVFLEAGRYSKPVIATFGSGIEDAVDHEKTGLLVPQHDVAATATALRRLLGDRAFAQRLGAANHAKSYAQRWEVVVERFIEMYRAAVHPR